MVGSSGKRYKAQRPATTADEIIRWATPVTAFQRTAIRNHELAGETIRTGQRVGHFYDAANFDDAVFEEPYRFNIGRTPNPHVGVGGGGVHYCTGASLAHHVLGRISPIARSGRDLFQQLKEIPPRTMYGRNPAQNVVGGQPQ